MTKPPEEGEVWEWRAFGQISESLARRIRSYPIRLGISDLAGHDIYLISPVNDQNVKLRKWNGEWVLKVKLLVSTGPQSIELYSETVDKVLRFPVGIEAANEAASILEVELPPSIGALSGLCSDDFVQALIASSPGALQAGVLKVRSQFQFDGGWFELARVRFRRAETESLSIQSPDIGVVMGVLDDLKPGPELEVMNYVEACRRWS